MSGLPALVAHEIEANLNGIAACFKAGAKLTLVVRFPGIDGDSGLVMTNDTFEAVIAELERRRIIAAGGVQ